MGQDRDLRDELTPADADIALLPSPAVGAPHPSLVGRFSPGKLWSRLHSASPFGSRVALTTAANVVIGLFGLATGPMCARLLGPTGRGQLAAIQNLFWLTATLAMLGTPEATLYLAAKGEHEPRRVLGSAVTLTLVAFPLFYLSIYFLVPLVLSAQTHAVVQTARWVLLGVPLYALAVIPSFALRGRSEFLSWNLARLAHPVAWLLLLSALSFLDAPTPELAAYGYLVCLALALTVALAIAHKKVPGRMKPAPSLWPSMLRYGVPLACAEIPLTLNLRLDQMLMAGLLPARTLGLYVVAVAWSGVALPPIVAIGTVLFPRVAGARDSVRNAVLAQAARLSVLAGITLAAIVAATAPIAIPLLFGQPFREAVSGAIVLAFATSISGLNVVFEEGLRGLGSSVSVFFAELAGLLVTITCLTALLRPFGILGAAVSSLFGYLGTTTVLTIAIRRKLNVSYLTLLVSNRGELLGLWSRLCTIYRSRLPQTVHNGESQN